MLSDWDDTLKRLHHALYVETREREGRAARPTAAIIDNRGPGPLKKGAALDSQGHDAGKDVTGRKRQILVSFPFIERSFPLSFVVLPKR
jgi:hypothetical protein